MVREKSRKELETRGGRPFEKICVRLLFCVCVCVVFDQESACKGVNLQVGLKKRKKSCLSNCHFGGGGPGRAGGIMGVV